MVRDGPLEDLRVSHSVACALADACDAGDLVKDVLRILGSGEGWDVAALWRCDRAMLRPGAGDGGWRSSLDTMSRQIGRLLERPRAEDDRQANAELLAEHGLVDRGDRPS